MIDFYIKVIIYFVCFVLAMIGLNAIDFNRFIKQGRVLQTYILYFILSCSLAYLFGQFLMSVIYYFN